MAIAKYLCDDCDKNFVCSIKSILDIFHTDAKKPLGVDIAIDRCLHYVPEDGE